MNYKSMITTIMVVLSATCVAGADTTMVYTPDPADLWELDHHSVYTWGIDVPLAPGESIISAELSFSNIRNWDDNDNVLYIHQLDWAELGAVDIHDDNQYGGDYFENVYADEHTHLVTYENLPSTPQDLTYTFTADDLTVLNSYLADGRTALGLDPDCHYYNCGVQLTLQTPEPASLTLLGVGALLWLRRRMW
ncbi:MAG: PEP-CTERM sorting domain-containing protein [Planctomycetota bacterium]